MEQRNMRELLEKYKYYVIGAAVVLVVIIALVAGGRKTETVPEEPQETQEAADQQEQEEEPNELEENSHSSIERLVSKYLDCIVNGDVDALESIVDELSDADKEEVKKLDKAYESYSDLKCYTKKGPDEDSYIVFVCCDMKIAGVETLAPYISCLYIGPKDESGNRYIRYNNVEEDQTLQAYVQELEQDPEVKALYDDVNARYQEALNSDPTLAEFVQNATGKANENTETAEEEAPVADEAAEQEDAQEETGEEPAAEEQNEEPAEEEAPAAEAQNRETRVTESVNIRSEASTDSDRIALAYQGDAITQIESYDNGWSKVEYKGETGYVKTEFLE
ncbi:MAG: SH3 domain-containing protein [Lachnospiraceae bacterium]|nr:SH3 domain-containing protein [Lachnospiraceae bacterium]